MGRIWSVCSGSGGVGKSTIALSLAVAAAKEGHETILLDASGDARSCDLILGLESLISLDMIDVLSKQTGLDSALYDVPNRPHLRFACASLHDSMLSGELGGIVLALNSMCDVLVIDLPTGAADAGKGIMRHGDERIIVTRPDAASVRSCEKLMMKCRGDLDGLSLVVNRMSREKGRKAFQYTLEAVENTLDRSALASIFEDPAIPAGERNGKSAFECDNAAKAALKNMIKTLLAGA